MALKAIESGAYETWLQEKHDIEPDLSDVVAPELGKPKGSYIFHFNPKSSLRRSP